MEERGSSVPGETGLPAGTATPDSSFEAVVAGDASTGCEGCCETMASTAVGDGGIPGSQQTVESELFSDAGQQGPSADPLKLSDSNSKDNVGTLPADNHTHGAFEPVCEEQRPASGSDHAEVVGSAVVGSREDDICDFPTFSLLPTVSHAELPDPPGTGAEVCRESYSNDDNSRNNKEFTSTAGGSGIIDSSAASTHASLLEGEVHGMDEPDQIKECGRNTLPPEPAKDLPGTSDSIDYCHSGHGSEDTAEYAHGSVAGAILVGNVDGQPEGPVHRCDDMEANQFNGGSDDPSELTVKPIGIMDANTHSSSDAIDEFVEPEKQDGVLSMHFGENVLQNDSCSLHDEEDDDFVKVTDNEKRLNDSSFEMELGNASQGSHLLAQPGGNALQVTSGASRVPEKGMHLSPEEESHNHSGNKVDMCNSCQESPGAKPSCSHLEDSSSYHLHPGPDALDSCQFTENAICGSMGSSYHDKHEDEGTCGPKLHLFRGQSGFQVEESSVADLQPPLMLTDCCLFPQGVAPFAGTDSDDGAKGTPTPCSSVAECQPECCDLPENGANNPTVTDPVSVPRRKNPVRAAHFKPMSTSVKSPIQASTATKPSGPKKTKKKKTPVSRSLGSVSFGNTTKKRSSRNGARSCGWGTIETVYKMFENSNFSDLLSELARTDSTSMMLRKGNGRKRSNSKKARKGSAAECVSDKNLLTQNDQRNSQVVLSRFVDLQDCENLEDNGTGQIRKCSENEQASTTYGCSQVEFSPCHMNLDNQAASSAGDAHIGDKDLESSVTLETSNENYPSDYHVVSSQIESGSLAEFVGDRRQAYADTSPESEIIHPASDIDPTTNDTAMYINQKTCGVNGARSQNDHFSDFHMQYNFDSANYAAPSTLTPPASLCSQPTNPIQGKDNGEVQGHSLQSVRGPLLEKTGSGFDFETNARYEQDNQTGARTSKCYKRKTKKKTQKEAQGQEVQVDCQSLKVVESRCPEETLEAELEMFRQYRALSAVHNDKNTGDICTEAKKSKSKPKLKDFARSKQHDPFGRKKKESNTLKKPKKNKEKSLCMLAPGDGHHEVDSRPEHIHDNLSTPSASVLGETAESNRSMAMNNLHNSQGEPHAVCLLDSGKISRESTTLINAEHGLQSFGPLEDRQCWVRCDDCFKWRFIPTAIADTLGEDCKWTCKDNIDKKFADCAVPQAKTDAEINEELGISDEEEYNTAKPQFRLSSTIKAKPQAPWTLIRNNLFLHRSRKKQNIDEVMVCQCRPPEDGSLGCRDACLNRMLNIECVRGTCPCGDLCSNQQFQRRKYAKLKWFRCGKKGYGLQVLQNVPHGKFLIEYVGEVLDISTYEARQREYASGGQRHFYFMTLNGSEVIDACYKGNLGRFINHSCNPNCRTEKWMVNGEVCIGLFAIRDIKKGEEVTFDYNYVRVFGAAAKKCFCGSFDCRGYIGADPLNAENIVQGDSDEEFPEPVMLKDGDVSQQKKKDGKVRSLTEVKRQDAINIESTRCEEHDRDVDGRCPEFVPLPSLFGGDECLQSSETVDNLRLKPPPEATYGSHSDEKAQTPTVAAPAAPLEGLNAAADTICVSLLLNQEVDVPLQVADTSSASALETNTPVVGEDTRRLTATVRDEELAKCIVSVKPSTPSVLAKNNRSGTNRNSGRKGKKMVIGGHSCHFEGVDGRLNELLDASGGISKHKDAARGYLKLLVLTANSRDNAESEANQSTRDLSLILDALLKTKSGKVLMDIINKNGVQMLHNILKQSHRSKNKVPILRKLLKVFEYFALKKVLTVEHINMNPSCEGAESFRDSIISLTQHADAQVHKIARNFRDTWMRRPVRKFDQLERGNGWFGLQNRSSCHSILSSKSISGQLVKDDDKILLTSPSIIGGSPAKSDAPPKHDTLSNETLDGSKRRRRRTRWDRDEPAFVDSTDPQPSEAYQNHSVAVASIDTRSESCSDPEILNSRYGSIRDKKHSDNKGSNQDNLSAQSVDEIPPGFDLMLYDSKNTVSSVDMSGAANDVVAGTVLERYLPHVAISHGIPIQLMQQLGTPANEGMGAFSRWVVAPGMPYHPFPPLPPYPRKKSRNNNPPVLEPTEVSPSMRSVSSSPSELALPSTSGRTSDHSRSYSLKSQAVKRGPSSMDNATGDSFRHQRCRDHKSNGFKTAWPRERSRHQVTGTKRCRTQDTVDDDVLEKDGGGSGFGSSPSRR